MGGAFQPLARALIIFGLIVAACGVVLLCAPKLPWIGRLPGDILIKRPGFAFYFPLASSLVVSILLSLLLWFFNRSR